jgi:hypothetical protein
MSNPFRHESITGIAQDEYKALFALSNVKVRALYLQLGGARLDYLLDKLTHCMDEGADSYLRRLSQDTADYVARCEDPTLETPKREKPLMSVREHLGVTSEMIELWDMQRRLALQAVRAANAGIEPTQEFIDAAKVAIGRDAERAARAVAKRSAIPAAPKPVKPAAKAEESAARTPAKAAA